MQGADGTWLRCSGDEEAAGDLFVDVSCPSSSDAAEKAEAQEDASREMHFLLKHCHYGHVRASVERCEDGGDSEFEVCLRDAAREGRKLVSWRWPLSLPEPEYRLRRQMGATLQKTKVGDLGDGARRVFACLQIGNHFFVYAQLARGSLLLLDTVSLSSLDEGAKGRDFYGKTNWPVPRSYANPEQQGRDLEQLHQETSDVVAAFARLRTELIAYPDKKMRETLEQLHKLQWKLGKLWHAVRDV